MAKKPVAKPAPKPEPSPGADRYRITLKSDVKIGALRLRARDTHIVSAALFAQIRAAVASHELVD